MKNYRLVLLGCQLIQLRINLNCKKINVHISFMCYIIVILSKNLVGIMYYAYIASLFRKLIKTFNGACLEKRSCLGYVHFDQYLSAAYFCSTLVSLFDCYMAIGILNNEYHYICLWVFYTQ